MTAIQLLESLGKNPSFKSELLHVESDSDLKIRAEKHVSDLLDSQLKIWCFMFPAEDDEPTAPPEDDETDEKKQSIRKLYCK